MKNIISQIKKSVVFLAHGEIESKSVSNPIGTGFIVEIGGFFHIVTAKHVVENFENKIVSLSNTKNKSIKIKPLFNNQDIKWIHHTEQDISVYPFSIDEDDDDIKIVPSSLFLSSENDVYELQDIFFASFDPNSININTDKTVSPILRSGKIAKIGNSEKIIIDATCYPGNSGSPVFTTPSVFSFTDTSINIGDISKPLLIGVLVEYIPYVDIAQSIQTKKNRISFEENSGLSMVLKSKYLFEIAEQEDFKNQLLKINELSQI